MEILISIIMGTRLLALFGGGAGNEAQVTFLTPRILIVREEVRLSCGMVNVFPEDLKKLAKTATPVVMYLFVELNEVDKRRPVKEVTVESRLCYDLIAKEYTVTQSIRPDTTRTASLDSAIVFASTFSNVPVIRKSEIAKDEVYWIRSYAVLGKTVVQALNNKEVDLMYYWNFKRPNFRTERISGGEFLR